MESKGEAAPDDLPVEERDTLAAFDFDGLFFQEGAGWKVRKAALGVVGSRLQCDPAFAAFRSALEQDPEADISDYFALDEYELSLGNRDGEAANQAPISRLLHYAHHHLFRRADLVVAAPRGFLGLIREMTDRAFLSLETFLMFENPFLRAVRCHPFDHEADLPRGTQERLALQVGFYASRLRFANMHTPALVKLRERFGVTGHGYEKIYIYHTQSELEERLRSFLNENHEKLVGGRNAIVPMLIADVQARPVPGGGA